MHHQFVRLLISRMRRVLVHRGSINPPAASEPPSHNLRFVGSERPNLVVGENTIVNGLTIYCWDRRITVSIGRYCSIADDVMIVAGGEHDIDWVTSYPLIDAWKLESLYPAKKPRWKGPISIGNDVWIGNRATILSGVCIGNGAAVGACSVVVKDVPPYAVVAGNPARVLRYRFREEQVQALQDLQWWKWSEEVVRDRASDFLDIEAFLEKYRHG